MLEIMFALPVRQHRGHSQTPALEFLQGIRAGTRSLVLMLGASFAFSAGYPGPILFAALIGAATLKWDGSGGFRI